MIIIYKTDIVSSQIKNKQILTCKLENIITMGNIQIRLPCTPACTHFHIIRTSRCGESIHVLNINISKSRKFL